MPRQRLPFSRRQGDAGLGRAHVENAEQLLVAVVAGEDQDIAFGLLEFDLALGKGRVQLAEGDEAAIMLEHGRLVALLDIDGAQNMFDRHRQPGLDRRKAALGDVAVPDHRRAAAVTAFKLRPELDAIGILQILIGEIGFGQRQFLALIEADGTAQRHQQRGIELGEGVVIGDQSAPAADMTHDVVIGEGPAGPAIGGRGFEILHHLLDALRRQRIGRQELEGVAHVHLVVAGGVFADDFEAALAVTYLADGGDCREFLKNGAEALQEGEILRPVLVVDMFLEIIGIDRRRRRGVAALRRKGGIVAQQRVVEIEIDGVEAEAIDASIEPEAHDIEQTVLHVRIMQVHVGLRGEEIVQVILHARRIPRPCRAAEDRQPVVRRRAVRLGVGPDIPVGLGVGFAGAALHEPGVLIGAVRDDQIDHHADAEAMSLRDHCVEVHQRAEDRIDILIIGNVVTEIAHRRGEEGRDPDRIDAEACHMRQAGSDALEVADAVAVGILIGARIDLIDHRAAPPVLIGGQDRLGSHVHGISCLKSRSKMVSRP
ncbi:hypothetical protein RHECNPAF_1760086 [Rhizobium etli CNPAF512]|nr:hypothetical protein RHECNPAF_1760086 [Rhizobium etli CNPAF512]